MRILVTGAGGQLGIELMAALESSGHDGRGLSRGDCDLTDRERVLAAIAGLTPDVVIHAGAFTAVDRCEVDHAAAYRTNALGTRFVAEGCRRVGAHLVYVSTDYVFDGTKTSAYVEWDEPSPRSIYGASKLGGERELDPSSTIARTSWVCSAQGSNMVKTVLRLGAGEGELTFVDDQIGQPTFAGDLAAKLIQLGVERVPGVHHVSNTGPVSWYEFVRQIMGAAGHDPERVRPISTPDYLAARPSDAPPMAERPANSVLDNFALRASGLGEMRDFREPLAETVATLLGA